MLGFSKLWLNPASRRLMAIIVAYIANALPLHGAEIKGAPAFENMVILTGNIETGDYEKLRQFIEQHDVTDLYLASPGGNVAEAIRIGRLVRALRLETRIPGRLRDQEIIIPPRMEKENFMCASACFFVFVAGVHRVIYLDLGDEEPLLGVHKPFFSVSDLKTLGADDAIDSANRLRALIDGYLKEMDVPAKYADLLFSVPKDKIRWITGDEFRSDLNGFIPGLKDWFNARCDKRTDAEKAMSEQFKARDKAEMKASEKYILDLLEKKQSEQEDCEIRVLGDLSRKARLKMFPEGK